MLSIVGVLVALGLVVDVVVEPTVVALPPTEEAPLLAGSTTCAALSLDEASEVTAAWVARPPVDAASGTAVLRLATEGDVTPLGDITSDGGAEATLVTGDGGLAALEARWEETPLLLSRRWTVDETQRVPGTVEGPCPAEPAADWVVPGVTTAGGAAATLHLANPTEGPASLSVTFSTPDGPVAPTRLANLAVEPHGQVTVDLNQFVPEQPDLGVVVQTRAGRVVAEVVQTLEAAVGGVDGRALIPAHPTTAEAWTIPWVAADEQQTAWVWVTNPGAEPTDVRLVLHTPTGPVVPPDSGVTLAPGTTQRIDLRGALAEVGTGAVTVRSAPGVGIVANGAVVRAVPDDPVRSGVAVVDALPASGGPQAAVSAVGAEGQQRTLLVANPGEEAAVVDVRVVGSDLAVARAVVGALDVPPGSVVEVPLADVLPPDSAHAVLVEPSVGVVAAAVVGSATEGPLDLLSIAARAFSTTATVTEPTLVRDRTLLHPLQPVAPEDDLSTPPGAPEDDLSTPPAGDVGDVGDDGDVEGVDDGAPPSP